MSLPRRQAASSRSTPYSLASRRMPRQERIPLLGMRLRLHDCLDQRDRGWPDLGGLGHDPGWRPLGVASMCARHVLRNRGVPVPHGREGVAGDARAAMENLDRGAGDTRLDDLADEPRWHRVIVAGDLDVVVGSDARPLPLGIAIRFGRQALERWTLDRLQQLAPALAELAHDLGVEIGDALPDRGVELVEREEAPVAQPRQDESLNDLHRHLRLCLVARLSDPRRQHSKAVMGGELLHSCD